MAQIIVCELGYPKSHVALERAINIGREIKRADIVVYHTAAACASNDQGNIYLIAEIKAPTILNPMDSLLRILVPHQHKAVFGLMEIRLNSTEKIWLLEILAHGLVFRSLSKHGTV